MPEQHKVVFYQFTPGLGSEHSQYLQQRGDLSKTHQAGKWNSPGQLSAFLTWRLQQQFWTSPAQWKWKVLIGDHNWHEHGTAPVLQQLLWGHCSFIPCQPGPSWPFLCPVTATWPWLSSSPPLILIFHSAEVTLLHNIYQLLNEEIG